MRIEKISLPRALYHGPRADRPVLPSLFNTVIIVKNYEKNNATTSWIEI